MRSAPETRVPAHPANGARGPVAGATKKKQESMMGLLRAGLLASVVGAHLLAAGPPAAASDRRVTMRVDATGAAEAAEAAPAPFLVENAVLQADDGFLDFF